MSVLANHLVILLFWAGNLRLSGPASPFRLSRSLMIMLFSNGVLLWSLEKSCAGSVAFPAETATAVPVRGTLALNQPIAVYNNWSAYDELSDNIELTEALALKELDQILRLRRAGVRIDYYLMDAFWYGTNGGYREFRHPQWPSGPDRWLNACRDHNIKPGLWVACNVPFRLKVIPEWESSMDPTGSAMCLFDGGFLPQFIDTLQFWYDRGVRLFKFDFANFTIATGRAARQFSKEEVFRRNCEAFRHGLRNFKEKNTEVLLAAFNGFGGETEGTFAPIRQTVDLRWLDTFDSLYCGDPRFSDVPTINFWRSMDIYSDHMVRYYEANGVPLERIDNTGCMFGVAGTCYGRRMSAWKSMLLLEHARGGWMNVYYGNLELIDYAQAKWFAKVQNLFLSLQSFGHTYPFGSLPGREKPYGFCSVGEKGSVYTVVNPSQFVQRIKIPRVHALQGALVSGRILFRDAGFKPVLSRDEIVLGPEQLALVGYGEYSKGNYDLGVQEDVVIPRRAEPLQAECHKEGTNSIVATVSAPAKGTLRIVMRQNDGGRPVRTSAGAPPNGTRLDQILRIEVSQDGHPVRAHVNYDKAIWSGLSWGAAEIQCSELKGGKPLNIRCCSLAKQQVDLKLELSLVDYD